MTAGRYRSVLEQARRAPAEELSAGVERWVAARALATASEIFSALPNPEDPGLLLQATAEALAGEPGSMCLVSLADADVLRPVGVAHVESGAAAEVGRMVAQARPRTVDAFSRMVQSTGGSLRMRVRDPGLLRLWLPRAYWSYAERARVRSVLAAALVRGGEVVGTLLLWREANGAPYSAADEAYTRALARRVALGL